MPAHDAVLFTVDDEAWTIGFWDQCEFDNAFGAIVYDGSDSLGIAMNYAAEHAQEPTVFVIDSRMYLSEAKHQEVLDELKRILDVSIDSSCVDESFNGVLVAAWIRSRSKLYRVVLLTAFARDIDLARRSDPDLGRVFEFGVSEMFVKTIGEKPLRAKVKSLLKEVRWNR